MHTLNLIMLVVGYAWTVAIVLAVAMAMVLMRGKRGR